MSNQEEKNFNIIKKAVEKANEETLEIVRYINAEKQKGTNSADILEAVYENIYNINANLGHTLGTIENSFIVSTREKNKNK